MNIASYWFGNYIFDFFLYMLVAAITIGISVALDIEALIEEKALDATALLFVFFGLANIPFTYILSYLFKDSGNAQAAIYFFNFVVAGIVPLIIAIFRLISNEDDEVPSGDVVRGLAWFLRFLPGFSFGEGLLNLGNRETLSIIENADKPFDEIEYDVFHPEIALAPVLYLVGGIFLYFGILFLI